MLYQNYRVKSPVKSFRDLEVYQKTIQLSDEIKKLEFITDNTDKNQLKEISESIPKLIAEAYGDRFDPIKLIFNLI